MRKLERFTGLHLRRLRGDESTVTPSQYRKLFHENLFKGTFWLEVLKQAI